MTKTNSDYIKIPVTPEVYERVKIISEANGYGERGLGKQVAAWAAQELPECEHKKLPVEIEYFPNDTLPGGWNMLRHGWYCPICKRVYARVTE